MDMPRKSRRPTPGQRALADALARGDAALGSAIETLPASVYTDPARFEAEQRAIFDHVPHLLAPSGLLPETRQAVAHDGYGTPLILTDRCASAGHGQHGSQGHRSLIGLAGCGWRNNQPAAR